MAVDMKLWIYFEIIRCEKLHFVMSYMKRNKKLQQTLKSTQHVLEVIFNPEVILLKGFLDYSPFQKSQGVQKQPILGREFYPRRQRSRPRAFSSSA